MTDTVENLNFRFPNDTAKTVANLNSPTAPQHAAARSPAAQGARTLYFDVLTSRPGAAALARSRRFLNDQLARARQEADDALPANMGDLLAWMNANHTAVGRRYRYYLASREKGAPRRYFPTKAHALHFLRAVAPTKLVDGSWLYGVTSQWRDPRYAELIRIYLEELGEGEPDKNHVALYRRLLASHDCDTWQDQPDSRFVQGAIQLSLACHAGDFLPEVIGFNLGYEQLPLHLLITAYELAELDIDPYYFTLHVTVDNAHSGHAARAVQAVYDAMPAVGDRERFYQRVRNGYQLNALGEGTESIIAHFDLEQELHRILALKARNGAELHSNYCRFGGKSITEWLREPEQLPEFIATLEQMGWIRRHESPENSRFWQLITGERAAMFGVFNAYERQIIHDWIAGDSLDAATSRPRRSPYRPGPTVAAPTHRVDDFSNETRLLREQIGKASDTGAALDKLVHWLSPAHHHSAAGLLATRMFMDRLGLPRQAE